MSDSETVHGDMSVEILRIKDDGKDTGILATEIKRQAETIDLLRQKISAHLGRIASLERNQKAT